MKKNFTLLAFLLDRSGSMGSIKKDIIGGFNTLVEQQKKEPGELSVTAVQFDSQDPFEILNDFSPVNEVKLLNESNYVPRGSTPLNDALGRLINHIGTKLANLSEEERPEKVIVAIITDGQENASHEFNLSQIKEMVQHQEQKYSWKFLYIGANQDTVLEAQSRGFLSNVQYKASSLGASAMYTATSNTVSKMRDQDVHAFHGTMDYTQDLTEEYLKAEAELKDKEDKEEKEKKEKNKKKDKTTENSK